MITIKQLGLLPYEETWQAMKNYTMTRIPESEDQLWILQHPPVFTQGQAGKEEHLINPGAIPVIQSDRGGQVTYHGPGQIVAYILMDLQRRQMSIRCLVRSLERSVIGLLNELNIDGHLMEKAPGVYVNGAKICSIGLRVKRFCSYHGIALNTAMDLTPFKRINPCGFKQLTMTQIRDFIPDVEITYIESLLIQHLMVQLQESSACDSVRDSTL